MKKILLLIGLFTCSLRGYSQGTAIVSVDSASNNFVTLHLEKTSTNVKVVNQIATIQTKQEFKNNSSLPASFTYAYPMPETGSAVKIRWKTDSVWREAAMVDQPQDSFLPSHSGGKSSFIPAVLDSFLGKTPFYFPVETKLDSGVSIEIELTYVELLSYYYNKVYLSLPGNYEKIQPQVAEADLEVNLESYRIIDSLFLLHYPNANLINTGKSAKATLHLTQTSLNRPFEIIYKLFPDDLGFFGFSNFHNDTVLKCDTLNGFFAVIVEPNTLDNSDVIAKDFVLIIDHSGSMSGNKMSQARDAAAFIVNNLNPDDRFNVVKFDDDANSLYSDLKKYDGLSKQEALGFISQINAEGSTNISGSFDLSVPLFKNGPADRAKIIIFFTDGQPSAGITNESELLSHVHQLIQNTAPDINLFSFGIGSDVNQPLLSKLALENNGTAQFLGESDLKTSVSNFYLTIQSPVLLEPRLEASPQVIVETYPAPLPNLYKGQQMIITGRYVNPGPVDIKLSGKAFGKPVTYNYTLALTDSFHDKYLFLTKIWAKKKIENLYQNYFSHPLESEEAKQVKKQIIDLSFCWGVMSPFTSFHSGNTGGTTASLPERVLTGRDGFFVLYPNIAHSELFLRFLNPDQIYDEVSVEIYDLRGILLYSTKRKVSPNDPQLKIDLESLHVSKGLYLCRVGYLNNSSTLRFEIR